MSSQSALYFIGLEPRRNGEKLACFATKGDQARIILDGSRFMALKSKAYLQNTGVEVLAHKLVDRATNSEMVSMSADSKSMDGLNLRVAFCDELHAMTRDLFDVITSGQKKRRDSLTICLTTAGFSLEGVGYSQSQYAKKVGVGDVDDPTFFSAVYTIDDGDDIHQELTWKKANPNYGVSVDPIAFKATSDKAKVTPSDLPNFLVKNLNQWQSEAKAFFNVHAWDKCEDKTLSFEKMNGKRAYCGMDLASKVDLASFGYVFKYKEQRDGKEIDMYAILDKSFIPEDALKDNTNTLFLNCAEQGYLIKTTGEAINYPKLEEEFIASSKSMKLISGMYDPWNATQMAQNLIAKRFDMQEFRMTVANLSEPMKALEALILERRVTHNGSPLLRWCLGNVVAKLDANDNVFPRKSNPKLKIDPIVAILMALAGWIKEEKNSSVYTSRGIRHI